MLYIPFILAVSICAILSDLTSGKIPNSLVLSAMFCAGAYRLLEIQALLGAAVCPVPILFSSLGGFLVPFVLLGLPAVLKMLGGGDVKLIAAFGLFLGFSAILRVMFYALFAGAALALLILIFERSFIVRFEYFFRYLGLSLRGRKLLLYRNDRAVDVREKDRGRLLWPFASKGSGEFPFSIPIFAGLLVFFFF